MLLADYYSTTQGVMGGGLPGMVGLLCYLGSLVAGTVECPALLGLEPGGRAGGRANWVTGSDRFVYVCTE